MKLSVKFTLFLIFSFCMIVLPAEAQQRRIKRLGTGDSFHGSWLKSESDFRNMVRVRRSDIDVVLQRWGWHGKIDDLVRAAETSSVTVEKIQVGTSVPFMAIREKGKPDLIRAIVWAGSQPFEAYVIEFESNGYSIRFHAPRNCGNFWVEEKEIAEAAPAPPLISVSGADVCVTQPSKVRITVDRVPAGASIQLTIDGQDAGTVPAGSGTIEKELPAYPSPGTHTVTASLSGSAPVSATVNVRPCPPTCAITVTPVEEGSKTFTIDVSGSQADPNIAGGLKSVSVEITRDGAPFDSFELVPPELKRDVKLKSGVHTVKAVATDAAGQQSTNPCEATVEVVGREALFFVAGFVGKDRLLQTLEAGDEDFDTAVDEDLGEAGLQASQCHPIVGFEFGVLPMIGEHAAIELSIGGKIDVEETDNSSIYADVALDGVFGRGFVGAGVSFWDLTEEDTRDVALLVHGGFGLTEDNRVQVIFEGRGPFDDLDDLGNNYILWGGIRFRF